MTASGPEQYGDFGVVTSLLGSMGIPPDFESDAGLRYTHRQDKEMDIYFIANPSNQAVSARCTFRVDGKRPQVWDAVTGEIRDLPEYSARNGRTSIAFRLEPAQSFFVVFDPAGNTAKSTGQNFPGTLELAALEGPWDVSFDPRMGGPEKVRFESLEDWTTRPEKGVRYFSGSATYRKSFEFGALRQAGNKPMRLWLDIGKVFNMARVRLNDRDLGVVWCDPWRVEVTDAIRKDGNILEIEVVNLWPNRLIGDEFQPPDADYGKDGNLLRWPDWLLKNERRPSAERYTFSTWRHFTKESALLPSGLLGPVRILKSLE
jgi:hypothetical protein